MVFDIVVLCRMFIDQLGRVHCIFRHSSSSFIGYLIVAFFFICVFEEYTIFLGPFCFWISFSMIGARSLVQK